MRLSGPAAFPGLSFESCLDTPLTVNLIWHDWESKISWEDEADEMTQF